MVTSFFNCFFNESMIITSSISTLKLVIMKSQSKSSLLPIALALGACAETIAHQTINC